MHRVDHCQRVLRALTGVRFPQRLILNACRSRVNQRTASCQPIADIVAGFSERQRDWYGELLADAGPFFGYSLWDDELTPPPQISRREVSLGSPGTVESPAVETVPRPSSDYLNPIRPDRPFPATISLDPF